MHHLPILTELAIITALGVIILVVLSRLRLPAVAGLLVAGGLLGPSGLALVESIGTIEVLAEVGVVLLLFTIGLEFSPERLRPIVRIITLGGGLQVLLTLGATVLVLLVLGRPLQQAVFFGFVVALSSTAIVLRALGERGELDAPHGRFIVGIMIFQDLCVVPMVLLVPILALSGGFGSVFTDLGLVGLKAVLVLALAWTSARYLVPTFLHLVDASRSREIFLLAVLGLCMGMAWLTSLAGLSLALGAFVGGLVVAGSDFNQRALGELIPLRNAFVSVFFISLGMLFDARIVLEYPLTILLLFTGLLFGKAAIAGLCAVILRFPPRVAWLAGIALAQFGEFGFVLLRLGQSHGLVTSTEARIILSAGVLSMFVTPLLIRLAPHLAAGEKILSPLAHLLRVRALEPGHNLDQQSGHVVMIGYGVAGRMVSRALAACEVPRVILELNVETVRRARAEGEPIWYADASSEEALSHAGVLRARAAVVLINDHLAGERVVEAIGRLAPQVPVFIRTRFFADLPRLGRLGASNVVVDEVEAGLETAARLLRKLQLPRNRIEEQLHLAREETQHSSRPVELPPVTLSANADLRSLELEPIELTNGTPTQGKTLRQLELRERTGALVVARRRAGVLQLDLGPDEPLLVGDILYVAGPHEALAKAYTYLLGT